MLAGSSDRITYLLLAWGDGDRRALDELVPLVHTELHRLAQSYIAREPHGHILQTTALVNEAYLRLVDQRRAHWRNRAQFFAISAKVMRRILVDLARALATTKRGGGVRSVSLDDALTVSQELDPDLVSLDQALNSLAKMDSRKARVVELRFFGGLSVAETAAILKVSTDTVTRDWMAAKAWLYRELETRAQS